ncbi:hypothetical protein MAR_003384 [Mya arenaria]|uniref:Secreted protein n=1 Tax=Mya arenaria TaxID=6604 RepID=A0ABY7GF46_MYAAR|nr:hypothetical protein MAR_003384 [Mya arenaria]
MSIILNLVILAMVVHVSQAASLKFERELIQATTDTQAGEDGIPINDSRTYGFDDSPEVVDDDIDGSAICHKGICKISCVIAKAVHNAMEVKQSTFNESFGCFKIPNKADAMQPLVSLDSEDIDVETDYMDSENIDVLADSFGSDKDDVKADTLE